MQRFFWELQLTATYSNLSFSEGVTYYCATSNRKFTCFATCFQYISLNKRRILRKSFIISQFSYYPLICMTHSRSFNNKINHIHERALGIVYKDFSTPFEGLLAKDRSFTIHNQNLQQLTIEIFKLKMGISTVIMKEVTNFSDKNN